MMNFKLVSAQGAKFDGEAYEVVIPTNAGTIAVFENHMPLISSAGDSDSDMENFAVSGGLMQVHGKDLIFLSDDITAPDDVTEQEAEAALSRAQQLIDSAETRTQLDEAHRLLHHSRAQLQVAKLKHRRHN
jgi:F-type H+-transporting ATPase subunit epsilon